MTIHMEYVSFVVFLLLQISFGSTHLSQRNNGLDSKITLKLIEKIGDLERKVSKLEKNEKQMMESIHALIQANAQFRLANMEFQKRLKNIEQEAKENVNKELDDRLKKLEKRLREEDNLIESVEEKLGYQTQGEKGSCEKSQIPACREDNVETVGIYQDAEGGNHQGKLTPIVINGGNMEFVIANDKESN